MRRARLSTGGYDGPRCCGCRIFLGDRKDHYCLGCRRVQREKRADAAAIRDPKHHGDWLLGLLDSYC